jgi:MtrB/PioB family decaheme-associated outer membrane protein
MMSAIGRVGLIFVALLAPLAAAPAGAQTQFGGWTLEGAIEAGLRLLPDEPSKNEQAKFQEYRDLEQGLFLESLRLRLFTNDERIFVELAGRAWGLQDQEYLLGVGRLGLWEGGFEWNQIPHTFSTNARFMAAENPFGFFTLPTPRPPLNQHNAAGEPDEIALRRDTARFSFKLTPTPWIDLTAEYTKIRNHGERPFGMAFGSPGNNFYEILEPLEQTTHDFRVKAVLAREMWQLQFSYGFSAFRNGLDGVVSDNPCFGLAAAPAAQPPGFGCASDATGAPERGQTALTPNNTAHTFAIGGGVNLPWWRTRLSANATYSLRFQNQDFSPQTINPAITSVAANAPLLVLPAKSLDGTVGITTVNVNATSRPLPPLTLTARYRLFDFNDMTDELIFPSNVVNDRSVTAEAQRAARFDQTRQEAGAEARWRFGTMAAVGLGGGWEGIHRSRNREVEHTDEYFARGVLDVTPWEWLLARLTYRPSFRRIGEYDPTAQLARTTVGDLDTDTISNAQSPLLRKLDESDRDRQRVDLMVEIVPFETFTASFSAGFRNDNYYNSTLGLQDATAWTAGVDLTWSPSDRISLSAGYNHESILQRQRSRSRPVSGGVALDFSDFDWLTTTTDTIETFYVALRAALIPRTLDLLFGARYEYALSNVANRNPAPVTSGTAAQRTTATALHFPSTEDSMFRLDVAARYHFLKHWTASVGYAFEVFNKSNWQTDKLNPFLPGVTSIWEGNDLKDYTAHIIAITLGYRF